jgi:hypothetical protein
MPADPFTRLPWAEEGTDFRIRVRLHTPQPGEYLEDLEVEAANANEEDADRRAGAIPSVSHPKAAAPALRSNAPRPGCGGMAGVVRQELPGSNHIASSLPSLAPAAISSRDKKLPPITPDNELIRSRCPIASLLRRNELRRWRCVGRFVGRRSTLPPNPSNPPAPDIPFDGGQFRRTGFCGLAARF